MAVIFLITAPAAQSAHADTILKAVGDVGGKSNSVKNLDNIARADKCFLGLGDYMYTSHPSTTVTVPSGQKTTLGAMWNAVECKVGFPGNHEEENGQEEKWAESTFKYGTRGYGSWKLNDIAIIGLDPYSSYKKGSSQYTFVDAKLKQFTYKNITTGEKRTDINWIIMAVHEPLFTPSVSGGHSANSGLRDTYMPLLMKYDNTFLLQAHNHITSFGIINGVEMAICGGGGYGGDTIGSLKGYAWGTSSIFGHCDFHFSKGNVDARLIGTDNTVKKEFPYP